MAPCAVGGVHDDGLQDPVLADVFGELVEVGVGEFGARIAGVFVEQRHRDEERLTGGPDLEEVGLPLGQTILIRPGRHPTE